ncbi:DUF4386 domain-containing protein [Longispora sp. NPDC051575]|uniref:DUF4386 domain-containing protein n=1 Tax=Longispora sp. NPDC051575 TaxID=3154943 RepID=UPI003420DE9C
MTSPTRQGGPPLGILGLVFTALFLGGLFGGIALGGGDIYPSPYAAPEEILGYFRGHADAVRISAVLQFAAAIPLGIYAATASARLHRLGVRAPGATVALAGGVLASAFLALSGMLTWTLSRTEFHDHDAAIRILHDLAFATGGPGHVVPLGLLVAGIAVPGLLARLLPRWLAVAGLVIAAVAELSTLSLLVEGAGVLLPIARFTGLIWLVTAGFLLPKTRKNGTES